MPIVTLIKPSLLVLGPVTPLCPDMAMPCPKGTCHNSSKLSHDTLLHRCEVKPRVGSDWLLSLFKLQPCLELCRFIQALLKTKVARWKEHFLLGTYEKTPMQHSLERMVYHSRYTTGKKGVTLGVS
jgi:hypothetical protein